MTGNINWGLNAISFYMLCYSIALRTIYLSPFGIYHWEINDSWWEYIYLSPSLLLMRYNSFPIMVWIQFVIQHLCLSTCVKLPCYLSLLYNTSCLSTCVKLPCYLSLLYNTSVHLPVLNYRVISVCYTTPVSIYLC